MTSALPAAVLWDMDGTLVDTEPYWQATETELVESFGGTWHPEDGLAQVGLSLWISAETLQAKGVPWDAADIIDHLQREVMKRVRDNVPWRPGARELLTELRAAGVPTALVTMSMRPMAEEIAAAFPWPARPSTSSSPAATWRTPNRIPSRTSGRWSSSGCQPS
ncbi:HAD family hydrolase [Naasia aerilata]|uniref:Haloacid dehalogenase-like hydrolase n=1 Tax=Naasia aerilata TaxID=1162966 RepID=A0ABM8GFZ0_9MICO|nr:hypothetical protein GCM10025866_31800 [Naasia aerilata]